MSAVSNAVEVAYVQAGSRTEFSGNTRDGLADFFDSAADVVLRCPGRVTLMGDHTEYNGGLALAAALPHCTFAAVAARHDDEIKIASSEHEDPVELSLDDFLDGRGPEWVSYIAETLKALLDSGWDCRGFDMYLEGSLPIGVGLGSSAALSTITAFAVNALNYKKQTPEVREKLLQAVLKAETKVDGAAVGSLDETVEFFCMPGTAMLLDFAQRTRRMVPLALPGHSILVTDTAVPHAMNEGGWAKRRAECIQAAFALGSPMLRDIPLSKLDALPDETLAKRARHVLTENDRVAKTADALQNHKWKDVRTLFEASQASLRDDFECSSREIEWAISTALESGAVAARITGGGFGGSIVSIVPNARVRQVAESITEGFAVAGWNNPRHLVAPPSGAASVV